MNQVSSIKAEEATSSGIRSGAKTLKAILDGNQPSNTCILIDIHARLVRSRAYSESRKRAVEKPCWRNYETCQTPEFENTTERQSHLSVQSDRPYVEQHRMTEVNSRSRATYAIGVPGATADIVVAAGYDAPYVAPPYLGSHFRFKAIPIQNSGNLFSNFQI